MGTIFWTVCLTKQVFADCFDITLDSCIGDPPFQSLRLASEENCQQYCRQVFPNICTFFIYDRQQGVCQLFDYDSQEYADSCDIIAATPIPSLTECQESQEDCLKFTEGYCMYNGYLMENLGNITSALACQFACLIYDQFPGCNYFSYNAVRENCQLLSSSVRTCDLIRGPPNPTFEECSEKPMSTTTPKTTITATTTTQKTTNLATTTSPKTTTTAATTTQKTTTTATTTTQKTTTTVTITTQKTTTTVTTPKSCSDNWVDFDQSCFYFAVDVTPMTWYNAKYYCESFGAHLAEVPDIETQNFLANYAATIKPASWWLGGTDDKNVSILRMYN